MMDKSRVLVGMLAVLGVCVFVSPSGSHILTSFGEGLLGIRAPSPEPALSAGKIRADAAAATLNARLTTEQQDELFLGLALLLRDQYRSAVPILGKYALMGDGSAQSAIGSMYYAGMGLAVDRSEGIRWLRLAAAQGSQTDKDALIAAVNGTLQWDSDETESADADDIRLRPQLGLGSPAPQILNPVRGRTLDPTGSADISLGGPTLGARASVAAQYGSAPASRAHAYLPDAVQPRAMPKLDFGDPVILNPAGPGTYSDNRGDIYTQAGPYGATNTRTGEFSPKN